MPARRHSTSHASNSESLVANSSSGSDGVGTPLRSTINPPECVSIALRICGHCAVSIQTRPFFTGNVMADESLANLGALWARGFHFLPPPFATSSAKRAAIVAGLLDLRKPPTDPCSSLDIRCKMSTARSSVLPPKRITAGISRSSSQKALANPYADQYCSWLATPDPEPKYPTRSG